jgi:NADPH:quinone reductase-like Zn-dependent oxidoreductase
MLERSGDSGETRGAVIPKVMLAAAIDRFGGPDEFTIHTIPVPSLAPNEVLIALDTAGVGPWDAEIRAGSYPLRKPQFPLVLGTDGAGVVAAAGSRVHRLKAGDKVYSYSWANPKGGFYAEYVAVVSDKVAHIPKGLDLHHAGAIATTGLTALQGIDDALHVKKGEKIIIHGGSGGVGTLAIQFAKFRGARVLATARNIEGLELVRDMGADGAIDARHQPIADAVRSFAPAGVDAVLALAGGDELEEALETLKRDGRLAYPNGIEPAPKKRRGIKVIPYDAIAGIPEFQRLNRAVESAKLKIAVAETFPLTAAAKAHARLETGPVLGKIVLRIQNP